MRLIDADKLEQKAFCTAPATVDNLYGGDSVVLLEDIENAPTIDPEDLRPKGEWIRPTKINGRSFNIPHCSVCDGVPCGVDENTHYCPNCGAKMEKK